VSVLSSWRPLVDAGDGDTNTTWPFQMEGSFTDQQPVVYFSPVQRQTRRTAHSWASLHRSSRGRNGHASHLYRIKKQVYRRTIIVLINIVKQCIPTSATVQSSCDEEEGFPPFACWTGLHLWFRCPSSTCQWQWQTSSCLLR